MITSTTPTDWRDLQLQVARILRECGFTVHVEKTVSTARGTVELDVYAEELVKGRKYVMACECKHWAARVPQTVVHAFWTVVTELGANVGYVITTSGFQSGAFSAAELTNVELITWAEFQSKFEDSWPDSHFIETLARLHPLLTYDEPIAPVWFASLSSSAQDTYMALRERYAAFAYLIILYGRELRIFSKEPRPGLPAMDVVLAHGLDEAMIPREILMATGYREFLELSLSHGEKAISEFQRLRDGGCGEPSSAGNQ